MQADEDEASRCRYAEALAVRGHTYDLRVRLTHFGVNALNYLTWIAAIVAVVALIRIAGPVLIGRASQTQRHQALATIVSDNNGFLSCDIHAGPGIYIRQQVRAPKLRHIPIFQDEIPTLNSTIFKTSSSPSLLG